jgi:hypothetical protein
MGEKVIPAVRDVRPIGFEDAASQAVAAPAGVPGQAPSG